MFAEELTSLQGLNLEVQLILAVFLSLCENKTLLILKACIVPGSQTWRCFNRNLLEEDIQIKFIKCSKVTPNTVATHFVFNMIGLR